MIILLAEILRRRMIIDLKYEILFSKNLYFPKIRPCI